MLQNEIFQEFNGVIAVHDRNSREARGLPAATTGSDSTTIGAVTPAGAQLDALLGHRDAEQRCARFERRACQLDRAVDRLSAAKAGEVIIFGHTHRALAERREGILIVNPGEAGGWLRGKSTVALLDPATLTVEIVTL